MTATSNRRKYLRIVAVAALVASCFALNAELKAAFKCEKCGQTSCETAGGGESGATGGCTWNSPGNCSWGLGESCTG